MPTPASVYYGDWVWLFFWPQRPVPRVVTNERCEITWSCWFGFLFSRSSAVFSLGLGDGYPLLVIFRTGDGFRSTGNSGRVNKAFHQPQQLQNIRSFFGKTGYQFDQFLMVISDKEKKTNCWWHRVSLYLFQLLTSSPRFGKKILKDQIWIKAWLRLSPRRFVQITKKVSTYHHQGFSLKAISQSWRLAPSSLICSAPIYWRSFYVVISREEKVLVTPPAVITFEHHVYMALLLSRLLKHQSHLWQELLLLQQHVC